MRGLLFILGMLVLVVVAAMQFGIVSIDQTRPGVVQAPRFEAEVGRVEVERPGENAAE